MAQTSRNTLPQSTPSRSVPSHGHSRLPMELSNVKGQMEPGEICAYNKTRECFLGQHVIAGEFTASSLTEWMKTLRPNSGAGVWMNPFRGILSADVPFPLDLLYLDQSCRVLEAVEFFPTTRVSAFCPPAASVVALPSHAIFSSQTQPGDQLVICPADEMDWRLDELARTATMGSVARPTNAGPALGPVLVRDETKDPVLPPPALEQPANTIYAAPVQQDPGATVLLPQAPQPPAPQAKPWLDPARKPATPRLGRLGRWLFSEPSDPRSARQPVAGLVAHFFTGGAPQAHEIRDVSATGLYVVTKERWYPGTVIRMTLTKPGTGQNPAERSITVHAQAVRWGNDGVALQFVAETPTKQGRSQASLLEAVDSAGLDQFLKRL